MVLVDYLQTRGADVLLIQTDTSNPDVGPTYQHSVETHLLELDENDSWIELLNVCADRSDSTIAINGPARDGRGFGKYGRMLNDLFYYNDVRESHC